MFQPPIASLLSYKQSLSLFLLLSCLPGTHCHPNSTEDLLPLQVQCFQSLSQTLIYKSCSSHIFLVKSEQWQEQSMEARNTFPWSPQITSSVKHCGGGVMARACTAAIALIFIDHILKLLMVVAELILKCADICPRSSSSKCLKTHLQKKMG